MPNFFHKENYVLYYENFQPHLTLGLKLKKMHDVLEFNLSQWLKQYIKFNTLKRKKMDTKMEKPCKD